MSCSRILVIDMGLVFVVWVWTNSMSWDINILKERTKLPFLALNISPTERFLIMHISLVPFDYSSLNVRLPPVNIKWVTDNYIFRPLLKSWYHILRRSLANEVISNVAIHKLSKAQSLTIHSSVSLWFPVLLILNFRSCQKIMWAFLWLPAQILWVGIPYELNQHDRLLRRANYLATYIRLSISSKNAKSSSMSTFLGSISHTFYHTVKISIERKGNKSLHENIKDYREIAVASSTFGFPVTLTDYLTNVNSSSTAINSHPHWSYSHAPQKVL